MENGVKMPHCWRPPESPTSQRTKRSERFLSPVDQRKTGTPSFAKPHRWYDKNVIYGLTVQKVGRSFELRCLECTTLTGRISLLRSESPRLRVHCEVHPENYGEWSSEAEMEKEKAALAKRIGLG